MNWQPIETAPKDGTWIQLWREPEKVCGVHSPIIWARWSDCENSWVWPDDVYDPFTYRGKNLANKEIEKEYNFSSNEFTHWMPLPLPPKD